MLESEEMRLGAMEATAIEITTGQDTMIGVGIGIATEEEDKEVVEGSLATTSLGLKSGTATIDEEKEDLADGATPALKRGIESVVEATEEATQNSKTHIVGLMEAPAPIEVVMGLIENPITVGVVAEVVTKANLGDVEIGEGLAVCAEVPPEREVERMREATPAVNQA